MQASDATLRHPVLAMIGVAAAVVAGLAAGSQGDAHGSARLVDACALRRSATSPATVTCTFANPSYAGSCVEKATREAGQTAARACQPILDCLNDARCARTYCQSTTIRQGWTLKSAE